MGRKPSPSVVGKHYGMLTVIDQRVGSHGTECLCKCDCGNIKWINYSHLVDKRRPVRSCGCLYRKKSADLNPGDRFGKLEVISFAGKSKSRDKQYLCKCDCGNTIVATSYQLKHGLVSSCGCDLKSAQAKIGEFAKVGAESNIVDGVNISSAMREKANRNSKTGFRGVWFNPRRNCYIASVQVHGERWHGYGYTSAESAKIDRDKKHEELIQKYGVTRPKGK
jgi:hypothetical protein